MTNNWNLGSDVDPAEISISREIQTRTCARTSDICGISYCQKGNKALSSLKT